MTADLLTDDEIQSSDRPVLHELNPDTSRKEALNNARDYLVTSRSYSHGEEKFVENIIPGYAGKPDFMVIIVLRFGGKPDFMVIIVLRFGGKPDFMVIIVPRYAGKPVYRHYCT
ncbi:protein fam166b-like [Plakobranchus ocellatus]|uniref:Protein fam166b-like n=1 Tax=Plakobranchus ocellatus TaxID=259542 RepID=A0AAV4DRI1_9GAST|nr:protein fam166b-like [Plakobranchus ocellatus]